MDVGWQRQRTVAPKKRHSPAHLISHNVYYVKKIRAGFYGIVPFSSQTLSAIVSVRLEPAPLLH